MNTARRPERVKRDPAVVRRRAGTAFHDTVDVAEIVVAFVGTRVAGPTIAEAPVLELRRVCAGFAAAAANVCGAEFRREAALAAVACEDEAVVSRWQHSVDGSSGEGDDDGGTASPRGTLLVSVAPGLPLSPGLVAAAVAGFPGAGVPLSLAVDLASAGATESDDDEGASCGARSPFAAVSSLVMHCCEPSTAAPDATRWIVRVTARIIARLLSRRRHCLPLCDSVAIIAPRSVASSERRSAVRMSSTLPQQLREELFGPAARLAPADLSWVRSLMLDETGCGDGTPCLAAHASAFTGLREAAFEHRVYSDDAGGPLTAFAGLQHLTRLRLTCNVRESHVNALATAIATLPQLQALELLASRDLEPALISAVAARAPPKLHSVRYAPFLSSGVELYTAELAAAWTALYRVLGRPRCLSGLTSTPELTSAGDSARAGGFVEQRSRAAGLRSLRAFASSASMLHASLGGAGFTGLTDISVWLVATWGPRAAQVFASHAVLLRRLVVTEDPLHVATAPAGDVLEAFEIVVNAHGGTLREFHLPLPHGMVDPDMPPFEAAVIDRAAAALVRCERVESLVPHRYQSCYDLLALALQRLLEQHGSRDGSRTGDGSMELMPGLQRAALQLHADCTAGVLPACLPRGLRQLSLCPEGAWDAASLRHALGGCSSLTALNLYTMPITRPADILRFDVDIPRVLGEVTPALRTLTISGKPFAAPAGDWLAAGSLAQLPMLAVLDVDRVAGKVPAALTAPPHAGVVYAKPS